ncbi:MAG: PHP domain-containing protein [Halanaerobiaceae bacterium]
MQACKCKVDLHVHTVLSPCADLLMTPGNILTKAGEEGTDILAVTDHNSAENVEVMMKLAAGTQITIIPGMEVETREEVHLLCLFKTLDDVMALQDIIYNALPDLENDEEYFGYQLLTDINDEYRGQVKRLLAVATDLSPGEVVEEVYRLGGVVIPSHIDTAHGLLYNLGLIPPELNLSVMEISRNADVVRLKERYKELQDCHFVKNSDSHYLSELKPLMLLELNRKNLQEIIRVLQNEKGKKKFLE